MSEAQLSHSDGIAATKAADERCRGNNHTFGDSSQIRGKCRLLRMVDNVYELLYLQWGGGRRSQEGCYQNLHMMGEILPRLQRGLDRCN